VVRGKTYQCVGSIAENPVTIMARRGGAFIGFIAELSDQPASELVSLSRPGNRWTPDARRRTLAFKTWKPWPPCSLRKMHYPIIAWMIALTIPQKRCR